MSEIEPIKGLKVAVNPDAMEPEEYFTVLKGSVKVMTEADLEAQLRFVASEILRCKETGQSVLAEKMEFYASAMIRERALLSKGYRDFIMRHELEKNIDKVTPKKGVKLIELSRFQRVIPPAPAARIKAARDEGLFDDYLVLFTDLTGRDFSSAADKQFIARNRDPICFGYFKETERQGQQNFVRETFNRLYLVADWADDQCDLTWDRLVTEMPADAVGHIQDEVVFAALGKRKERQSWTARLTSLWKR